MANLKTLKSRIRSVKSTQKITKAMKMVAASRLKKAKNLVEISRPFAEEIYDLTSDLASNILSKGSIGDMSPLLTGRASGNNYLIVVLSSDRGLCGGLNSANVRFAKNHINSLILEGKKVKIFCIGKKAHDQLKSTYGKQIIGHIFGIFKNQIDYKKSEEIALQLIERFNKNEFDFCQVIYSKFKSAISQIPVIKQVIPVSADMKKPSAKTAISYEPSQEAILQDLLPKNLAMQIYNELLENNASEQGARMSAMESATNNASKMIKNLTLIYNRTRQANITRELIDIISGANSV
jgi:F-type H+-transporting ATPase subunit gamma